MALVYAQNVLEIAVKMRIGANIPHVNVWHYRSEEGVNAGDEAAVRDFANNWQDHIMGGMAASMTLLQFDWRSLDPDDNNVGTVLPDTAKPTTGGLVGEALPPNCCYLVKKNTANRPRGRRDGRAFIAGVLEANVDALGILASTTVTGLNTRLADFYAGVTDNPVGSDVNRHLVVLETTPESRAPGTNDVTVDARRVTSLTLDTKIATQRDRLR